MPFTKGASNATGPYVVSGTQTYQQANNSEYQYDEATNSFEQDLFVPFIFIGMNGTKDGTIASQLNVAAGVSFVKQTDLTLRRRAPTATNFSTTGHPSTTMYLFFQSDGTYSWQTSSTPPTNALAIAHCTTDGSSNILVVTDDRVTITTLLPAAPSMVGLPPLGVSLNTVALNGETPNSTTITTQAGAATQVDVRVTNLSGRNIYLVGKNAFVTVDQNASVSTSGTVFAFNGIKFGPAVGGSQAFAFDSTGNHETEFWTPQSGSANGHLFITWNGSAQINLFGLGATGVSAAASIDNAGTYSSVSDIKLNNGTNDTPGLHLHDGANNTYAENDVYLEQWRVFTSYRGAATTVPFRIDIATGNLIGNAGTGLPTTRNGAAVSAPIYTGANTPSSPPTGSIWSNV